MNHKGKQRTNRGEQKNADDPSWRDADFRNSPPPDYQPESGVPVPERRADRDGGNDGRDPVDDI